jgi:acetyl-CoA C-acetyltransferase
MGLRGEAAIVGFVELAPERKPTRPPMFTLEQWARLAKSAIEDAGLHPRSVNGFVTGGIAESSMFVPATLSEYLGLPINFGEVVDLGGASSAGMVWRAAAAIELGLCDAVLCIATGQAVPQSKKRRAPDPDRSYFGSSSNNFGSPQAEFEIPYGNLGQNAPYAQIARRYASVYGYDERATAKISADQRTNACATPDAIFYGQPITVDDVLASPMVADPLHKLEMVMPCSGGAGVLVTNAELAAQSKNRPVWVKGFGEHLSYKTPTYAEDLLHSPIGKAADLAFDMSGLGRGDVDMASVYDCNTLPVLLSLEDAGFCAKGEGMEFVRAHDLTFRGDFPLNTAGGQLSFGQAGMAGGMHHVCDATRQLMGRAGDAQVDDCNVGFVSGNGGIMSEQVALVLQGN